MTNSRADAMEKVTRVYIRVTRCGSQYKTERVSTYASRCTEGTSTQTVRSSTPPTACVIPPVSNEILVARIAPHAEVSGPTRRAPFHHEVMRVEVLATLDAVSGVRRAAARPTPPDLVHVADKRCVATWADRPAAAVIPPSEPSPPCIRRVGSRQEIVSAWLLYDLGVRQQGVNVDLGHDVPAPPLGPQ